MNIIKTICLLCKEKKTSKLLSVLGSCLRLFINKTNPIDNQLSSFLSQFTKFKPSLQIYPSTDIELNTMASDSLLNKDFLDRGSNVFPLKPRKKSSLIQDPLLCSLESNNFFDFSSKEIKSLFKVFPLLNSKKIKILILLLENGDVKVRKLATIFFQVILKQSKSKIHFVEKCALGYAPGLYCLTRIKYIQLKGASALDLMFLFEQIRGFVKTMITKIELNHHSIHGKI